MRRDNLIHALRQQLKRLPAPHDSHYGVVPLPPPEGALPLGAVRRAHEEAVQAIARADALAKDAGDPYIVSRILARREAVASSSIEGTNSTLDELLRVEEGATDPDAVQDAAHQVRDYALALERIVPQALEQGPAIFDRALIEELHRAAMQGDTSYQDVPGELRTRVVWIGGVRSIAHSTYNPAPPDDVPDSLEQTLSYMRLEGVQAMTQGLIERMAVAHAHFEAVHPFRDGNGRVGRFLLPLMMAAEGHVPLYLSPYIEANQDAYVRGLKAAQQQLDWAAMTGFVADAINGTVAELMATRVGLEQLKADWASRRTFRKGSGASRSLDMLVDYPVVTAKRLAERLSLSIPAAQTAIDQLVDASILEERTGYRRNRLYAATEALAIVNRPFGEPVE